MWKVIPAVVQFYSIFTGMKKIAEQIRAYIFWIDKRVFAIAFLCTATGVFCNYYFNLNRQITQLSFAKEYACWYILFLGFFSFAYMLTSVFKKQNLFIHKQFLLLLLAAPAIFSWKMSAYIHFDFTVNENANAYWNTVLYWPFKLFIITGSLFFVWKVFEKDQPLYGLSTSNFVIKPYLLMLLIMVPLIAAASTQPDFLTMYPKLKTLTRFPDEQHRGLYQLIYELSYGSDFFGIELFFRGFLILGFAKWAGKDAILPMAMFYCAIHFGKPLGECISSFFGGLVLGVVTYHSKTIWGGLLVHLGIAWLMELGGYFGNLYFNQ